ncbi:MAG: hypothetical protein E7545_01645 [Ruminococcaceae bacterium]|nr:hypothetical protein [Oscillospiraceae bacterium]
MKNLTKVLIFICCFAIAFTAIGGSVAAYVDDSEHNIVETPTNKPLPEDVRVVWYRLNNLINVEKETDKLTMNFKVNSNTYKLYLVFPKEGGFRLFSDDAGYFEPDSIKEINYSKSDDALVCSAGDNTSVKLRQKENNWSLDIYNKDTIVYRITGKQLSVGYDKDNNFRKTRLEGTIGSKETLTGLGQRYDQQVRNGTKSLLWNIDAGDHVFSETQWETDMTYTNIPLLHSTNGYSVFFNSSYAIEADIGKADSKKYTLENYGKTMDLYFWTGKAADRLDSYMQLTGYNILPPKWAFSYWAGNSAVYFQNANGGDYINELQKMMDGYTKIGTPIQTMFVEGVIYKDTMVHSLLKKTDTKVIAWHDSAYNLWSNTLTDAFPGLSKAETPIVKRLYNKELIYDPATYIDFTDERSAILIDHMYSKYLKYGTKGAMIDFADAVGIDTIFSNGKTGDEMHNIYAYYYQKAFKELYEKYHGDDYILFARAGYAGSQSLMAKFLGDCDTTMWGLSKALTSGLNLSSSGFSIWGSDMGGLGRGGQPNEDTYRRWVQWSAFNPLFRSHGSTTRVPWDYSESATKEFQKYYWLRENLIDAIYSGAIEGSRTNYLMAKPLNLAFPEQPHLAKTEGLYMFCEDILVAPVTEEYGISKSLVLPNDNWTDFWTGQNIKGGTEIVTRASEGTIPLYLKAGSVIPVNVSNDLVLGNNMEDGSVAGILISPATTRREIQYNKDTDTVVKYVSDRSKEGTTKISNTSKSLVRAVIAKGISASSVVVDGVKLKKYNEVFADGEVGYSVDHVNNTTTIWLPEKWSTLEVTNGGGISRNLALNSEIVSSSALGNKISNVNDKDYTNYWTLPSTNPEFEIVFDDVKEISEIQLTWGFNYAKAYSVEISSDGYNYTNVANITEGLGDEEVIKLDKTYEAQYIRFSGFEKAQQASAELCDVRIYGSDMDYIGICDVTGNISADKGTEEDNFTDFEEDDEPTYKKKVIRRKFIPGSLDWWVILIIVVVSVVVAGAAGLTVFILIRKKKSKDKTK